MHSPRTLNELVTAKAMLRRRIALRRTQTAVAAARVAEPLVWIDSVRNLWRELAPPVRIIGVPLGFAIARLLFKKRKVLGQLERWAPIVIPVARAWLSWRKSPLARTPPV